MHHYTVQRSSPSFAPLPAVFWPDRWLAQDTYTLPSGAVIGKDKVTTDRTAFAPFSAGPQNCAGKAVAMMELRGAVCAVVQRFERMEVAEGFRLEAWEEKIVDVYVTMRGPLLVKLRAQA